MRNIVFYLLTMFLLIFLLNGCATTPTSLYKKELTGSAGTSSLYKITISSFSKQRFSGLLAVTFKAEEINYFLLDSTSIKLLEANVKGENKFSVLSGVQKIKESKLPSILSRSLYQIFLLQPNNTPCSSTLIRSLCKKKLDGKTLLKYSRMGPFPQWEVRYTGDEYELDQIVFTGPWYGPQLELTALSHSKSPKR